MVLVYLGGRDFLKLVFGRDAEGRGVGESEGVHEMHVFLLNGI